MPIKSNKEQFTKEKLDKTSEFTHADYFNALPYAKFNLQMSKLQSFWYVIFYLKKFIEENIKNPLENILQAAVKCLKSFLTQYHRIERD